MQQKPPIKFKQFYKNIFEGPQEIRSIELLSKGLKAIITNTERLLSDVELLISSGKFASASFLRATADEEMAKFNIMLDMCRLDFEANNSTLKKLCSAFYDHIYKLAYNRIVRHQRFYDMQDIKSIWLIEVKKWWPSEPESGEPSFPNSTYFTREVPLYVEFLEYDNCWHIPSNDTQRFQFESSVGLESSYEDSLKMFQKLLKTNQLRLIQPECLSILHDIYKDKYISDKIATDDIYKLFNNYTKSIENKININRDDILNSAIFHWPLYHFVTLGKTA